MPEFVSGDGETTQIGYTNPNGQTCMGTLKVKGTDYKQYAYWLKCGNCGHDYGANGSDIALRLCPACQGGQPGIRYWLA